VSQLVARGVETIAYKGPLLAVVIYGSIAGREFGDLDILVRPADYEAARTLLREQGYAAGTDWGWESSWHYCAGMVRVDLHRAITVTAFPLPIDFDRLHSRLEEGSGVLSGIGVLRVVDTLILLCVELAKDAAGEGQLRLRKVCDIAELLRAHPDIDWRQVHEESRRLRCERVIAFGLLAARTLLGAPVTDDPFRGSRIDGPILLRHLRVRLFPAGANGTWRLTFERFHFSVRERWRDKLYPYYLEVRARIAPNAKDLAVVPLPRSLHLLYYVIRPLRLMRDFARSRLGSRGP
jgi:hypothetical protein